MAEKEKESSGVLHVVAGPIGNLGDITLRAIAVLKGADMILCEDTRTTGVLLKRHEIAGKRRSYNEHNEARRIPEVLEALRSGARVALLSDAGTPGISDPGYRLVRAVSDGGFDVRSAPGPSACVAALSVSGLPTDRFVFEGFLPRKKGKRMARIEELSTETRTVVIYESVHRIERTLGELEEGLGDREVCVLRELTKKFEEAIRGQLCEVREQVRGKKGEFVIVLRGKTDG
jgi:16S rRNA (cytidine1402-2'-O)-methyltransferase